jgi:hypothetical protein
MSDLSVSTSITVHTERLDRIKARLGNLDAKAVVVGWPGDGSPLHQERDSSGAVKTSPDTTVAYIATVHEFGSPSRNIPARPILKTAAAKYGSQLGNVTSRLYKGVLAGSIDESKALAQLGLYWEGKVRRVFTDSPGWAELRPATIARKTTKSGLSGAQPLIDTGHLRRSVTSRVVGAGYR